jgi:glycosyltransferase involved in cell wall biosynthesis
VDGETGVLVDPDDFEAFADALRTLAGNAELRRRYGAAAVARCRALFSMVANATAISQVYRRVTAERGAQEARLSSFA